MSTQGKSTAKDRWSFKPAFVSLAVVGVLVLLCQIPGSLSFFLIPLSLLSYGLGLIVILLMAGHSFIKKCPRRGTSIILVFLLPALSWRPLNRLAEFAHLGLTVGFGEGQLGSSSKSVDGTFVAYDWSVGLAGGPNTFLIHDVTDEIALPMAQHTHSPSSADVFEEECAGRVQRLTKHYYVCTF